MADSGEDFREKYMRATCALEARTAQLRQQVSECRGLRMESLRQRQNIAELEVRIEELRAENDGLIDRLEDLANG